MKAHDEVEPSASRIAAAALALAGALAGACLALAGHHLRTRSRIQGLEARLLGEEALQAELVQGEPRDHVLIPHAIPEIGLALNPRVKRGTWKARDGESYPINALGLRGRAIGPKPPGGLRVLLVGDSVLFGWKLSENETPGNVAQAIIDSSEQDRAVEVLTIAIPGWNVRSQAAFLEAHANHLRPDILYWCIIPNDVEDVAGVFPPGILARYISPQAPQGAPFAPTNQVGKSPLLPANAARWAENLARVSRVSADLRVPVVLFRNHLMEAIAGNIPTGPGAVQLIAHRGRPDRPRSQLVLSDQDPHPSPYAARLRALEVLFDLVDRGLLREPVLEGEDRVAWERLKTPGSGTSKSSSNTWSSREPLTKRGNAVTSFRTGDSLPRNSRISGILESGVMAAAGGLLLFNETKSIGLRVGVRISSAFGDPTEPALTLDVTDLEGNLVATGTVPRGKGRKHSVDLTIPAREGPLVLSWQFSRSHCSSPTHCFGGQLDHLEFLAP